MNKRKNEQSVKIKINKDKGDVKKVKMLIENRIEYIDEIIRNTLISITQYKNINVFGNSDIHICVSSLKDLYKRNEELKKKIETGDTDANIDELQKTIDKMSVVISGFGTLHMDDLLYITFGSEFKSSSYCDVINAKLELIRKYVHPIGFKIINARTTKQRNDNTTFCIDKLVEDTLQYDKAPNVECFDTDANTSSLNFKINGINIILHSNTNKTIVISGYVDDINLEFFDNLYINTRKKSILKFTTSKQSIKQDIAFRQVNAMTLKDTLVYGNNDIVKKYNTITNLVNNLKKDRLEKTVNRFVEINLTSQRNMLINLLIYNADAEVQYITYLLYDLITMGSNNDSNEQMIIYESFPSKIKEYFKETMKHTLNYTQEMNQKYDLSRITLEQQIYIMRVSENVKDKAVVKLKEIKGKSDESGAKAKQYLEGLLKIPFDLYRKEPVLNLSCDVNNKFQKFIIECGDIFPEVKIEEKKTFTNFEISNFLQKINTCISNKINETNFKNLSNKETNTIFRFLKRNKKINVTTTRFNEFKASEKNKTLFKYIKNASVIEKTELNSIIRKKESNIEMIHKEGDEILKDISKFGDEIEKIEDVLNESVYGHSYAKNQIMKIICQWISGEQRGYCFGFEGSPGIGKTSLAKNGLAHCLTDENNDKRPFSLIALGGSCNGSTLEGHGYTYVNSTWGRIVDILMESKCMNPIIYIDELDKVSKSEHGKEIIGILTHLIDSTQNDSFQDKYFSGIDIDLSKALFIFSYNDPSQIDRILLDRIHRIKFDNLTIEEKIVIVNKYLLPEINKKMGFSNIVTLDEDTIIQVINNYTMEPGVRKLKELLFDIFGEINIDLLKNKTIMTLPIQLTIEDIEEKYLKNNQKIREKMVHNKPSIGIINGLWANILGKGGIIPIEVSFCPATSFMELKLTGLQGDVMKESMNVSKTLAWNITDTKTQQKLRKEHETNKLLGIHIHCPEGGVSKDGPSAGTAITLAIYSLLNKKKINNCVAITGEIDLIGNVTAIGGLEDKILGGIRAGVKKFLFPKENAKEYKEFCEKNREYKNIEFVMIETVRDTFSHIFV